MDGTDPTSVARDRRVPIALAITFSSIAILAGIDLAQDLGEGTGPIHLVVEGGLFAIGIVGLAVMVMRLLAARRRARLLEAQADSLRQHVAEAREDAQRWRSEARVFLDGLSRAIDQQFARWELTDAEVEVARLLLKGLSHKEIAEARGTSDSTTRQQARAVYRKAGLAGRHDLAAFFLEDLLVPSDEMKTSEGGGTSA